jgi:hypothetical protein
LHVPASIGRCCFVGAVLLFFSSRHAWPADGVDFTRDVRPILKARCFACHGSLKQESGLRLDSAASALKGGDGGEVILPGQADASPIAERIAASDLSSRMPPEGPPLTPAEIDLIRRWIEGGAVQPEDDSPEPDPRDHWAFRPPVRPPLPGVQGSSSPRTPIDAFILDELQARGLSLGPEAPPELLLRRVYLDLVGLPPTRQELDAYLSDSSPDAYERVVDRLLASPRYGERWGRHWMDVWRYSDWYGRRSVPDVMNSYPRIWRWRDWIVSSLNDDLPYDRMVTLMLAADEVCPEDDASLPATGFIVRNWFKWNYNAWMKDQVEHTAKAFLGLTMNCTQCHDHKYDPITQEEYFKFRACFEPMELRHDRVAGEPDPGPFKKYVYAQSYGPIASGMIRVFDEKLDAQTFLYVKGDERNRIPDRPPLPPGAPAALGGGNFKVEPVLLPPTAYYPGLKPFVQNEETALREAAVEKARAAAESARARWDDESPRLRAAVESERAELDRLKAEPNAAASSPIDGEQSLLVDASAGRRTLAHRVPGLLAVDPTTRLSFHIRIFRDGHANVQLARNIPAGHTAALVAFVKGKVVTYRPGTFEETEVGAYNPVLAESGLLVTVALVPHSDQIILRVTSAADGQVLVDGATGALNGWNPRSDENQGLFLDVREGTVAAFDNLRIGPEGGTQHINLDFEPPAFTEGADAAGTGGFLETQFSAAPATARIVRSLPPSGRIARQDAVVRQAENALAARELAADAADRHVQAAECDLASLALRIQADQARYYSPATANVSQLSQSAAAREREAAVRAEEAALADAEVAAAEAASRPEGDAERPAAVEKSASQLASARDRLAKAREALARTDGDYTPLSPVYPDKSTGRRRALASWITSRQNPLTARVAANHLWMRHFGQPLVDTPTDFGRNGAPPTHPELLDWLAVQLMESEWQMKPIHRMIVLSAVYRQQSGTKGRQERASADSENRLLWHFPTGRMQAEVVRDSVLGRDRDRSRLRPERAAAKPVLRRARRGEDGVPRAVRRGKPLRGLSADHFRGSRPGPGAGQQRTVAPRGPPAGPPPVARSGSRRILPGTRLLHSRRLPPGPLPRSDPGRNRRVPRVSRSAAGRLSGRGPAAGRTGRRFRRPLGRSRSAGAGELRACPVFTQRLHHHSLGTAPWHLDRASVRLAAEFAAGRSWLTSASGLPVLPWGPCSMPTAPPVPSRWTCRSASRISPPAPRA